MTNISFKHRHYLAAPVFIAALAAILFSGGMHLSGSVVPVTVAGEGKIAAHGADKQFSLPRGISGLLREDGILFDTGGYLSLEEGTVLVASDGLTDLDLGDVHLSGFHGGFTATKAGGKVSVLALTTPVLLTHGDFRLVIPVGMQGQWDDVEILPEEFALEDLAVEIILLETLPDAVARDERKALAALEVVPLPPFDVVSRPSSLLSAFALPVTKERLHEASENAHLEHLREALEEKDIAKALALLRDDHVRENVCSQPREHFSVLLSLAGRMPSAAAELLQCADGDLWLLASLHPGYRRAAWETSGPLNLDSAARIQRWLQLPSSDVGQAIPERVIDQWQQQLEKYLKSAANSEEFLEALLFSARTYRDAAEEELPARAQRYHRALAQLVEPYEESLTEEGRQYWEEWESLEEIPVYADPHAPAPEDPPKPPEETLSESISQEPFDPGAVEAQARRMLQDTGALFTVNTTITAQSASQAAISGILFASESGEHQYAFTLDIAAKQLFGIKRDGVLQPYPLMLEAFVAWARGG